MDELQSIQEQIAELQRKAEEIAKANRLPVHQDIKSKIQLYKFTAKELGFSDLKADQTTTEKKPLPVKYKLENNTWTGRGAKPKWFKKYIEDGGNLEDITV